MVVKVISTGRPTSICYCASLSGLISQVFLSFDVHGEKRQDSPLEKTRPNHIDYCWYVLSFKYYARKPYTMLSYYHLSTTQYQYLSLYLVNY